MRRLLPDRCQPSPFSWRVGFRIARFEACSAFTHVAAHMVAKPPLAARYIGVLQTTSLPPSSAPTATGWSDSCRAGFAPAVEWRLPRRTRKVALSVVEFFLIEGTQGAVGNRFGQGEGIASEHMDVLVYQG